MKLFLVILSIFQMVLISSCGQNQQGSSDAKESGSDMIQAAIDATMDNSREEIAEHGFTDRAIEAIKKSLADLAHVEGLRDREDLRGLHGSTQTEAVVLASDGQDDLTLILARFAPNEPTPVHDHGTWAVLHVLDGRDRYIKWKRIDNGTEPGQAQLEKESEQVLHPGDAIHWYGPPHDIHSQVAQGGPAWELILAGSNMLLTDRHYFDPESGEVTTAKSQDQPE